VNSDDMNPSAKRMIDLARAARTPDDADKWRVRRALALGIGAAVAGASSGTALASAVKAVTIVSLRGILAAALLVSAGTGTYFWMRGHAPGFHGTFAAPARTLAMPAIAPTVIPSLPAQTPDPLLAELTLLRRAQQALKAGAPRRALELAERHALLYPDSQLALERGALRTFAFCALGRKTEARALASQLLAAAPLSPLRASLENSCATR
jgi:hypothetical protein